MEEIKIYPVCKRCGRKLKSEEARERGMGRICYLHCAVDTRKHLFDKYTEKKNLNNKSIDKSL